mmetsp:Transcript_1703/g.5785  ORF Transcript_1703/g.5785 Transcript_1703/m.5785 type:complete len:328 (+) Transcript_1703:1137-2120(+)
MRRSLSPMVSSRSHSSLRSPVRSVFKSPMVCRNCFLSSPSPKMVSFCSWISFCSWLNFFFMMPFSPFKRNPTSRASAKRSSYFCFISSTSRSMSSSIWSITVSLSRVPRSSFRRIFSRSRTSSRNFPANSSVSSCTTRSCRSASAAFCSSHFSFKRSLSHTRAWYRSTSASIFREYPCSVSAACDDATSSALFKSVSNCNSCSFFDCASVSNRALSPSSSAVNFSVKSLIFKFMFVVCALSSCSFSSVSSATRISSALVLESVSSMSALVTKTSSLNASFPRPRKDAPSLSLTSNTLTHPSLEATNRVLSSCDRTIWEIDAPWQSKV